MAATTKRIPKFDQDASLKYFLIASFILHIILLLIIPERERDVISTPSPWDAGAINITFQPLARPQNLPGVSLDTGEQTVVDTEHPGTDTHEVVVPALAEPGTLIDTLTQAPSPSDRTDLIQPQALPEQVAPPLQAANVGEVIPDRAPAPQDLPQVSPAISAPASVGDIFPDRLPSPQTLPQVQPQPNPATQTEIVRDAPPAPQTMPQQVQPQPNPATRVDIHPDAPPAPQTQPIDPRVPDRSELVQADAPTPPAIDRAEPAQIETLTPTAPDRPEPAQAEALTPTAPDRPERMEVEAPAFEAPDRPVQTTEGPSVTAPERVQPTQSLEGPTTVTPTANAPERPDTITGPDPVEWQTPGAPQGNRPEAQPESFTRPERDTTTSSPERPSPDARPEAPSQSSPSDQEAITRPTVQPPPTYGASLQFPSIGMDPPKDMITQQPVTVSVLITFDEHGVINEAVLIDETASQDASVNRDAPLYVQYTVSIKQPAPTGHLCQAIVHVTFDPTAPADDRVRFSFDEAQERLTCFPV